MEWAAVACEDHRQHNDLHFHRDYHLHRSPPKHSASPLPSTYCSEFSFSPEQAWQQPKGHFLRFDAQESEMAVQATYGRFRLFQYRSGADFPVSDDGDMLLPVVAVQLICLLP